MGRPKINPEHCKSMYVRVRVTKKERAEIRLRAKKAEAKNEAEWIRNRLLGDE